MMFVHFINVFVKFASLFLSDNYFSFLLHILGIKKTDYDSESKRYEG